MSVVAGGHDNLRELLKSVEIIFLNSKTLGKATNMVKPRNNFNLIVMDTKLLALGGFNETSIEVWEGVGGRWNEASMSLTQSRRHFSALTLTDSVCLPGPIPPHSCPTLDEGTCVFPFTNGRQSKLANCNHGTFLLGSETYSSCVREDANSFWCSTPSKTWAQCHTGKCPLLVPGNITTIVCDFKCLTCPAV